MTTPALSIGELSRCSGANPHTLRYEEATVLAPVARDHASPVSSHSPVEVTCRI